MRLLNAFLALVFLVACTVIFGFVGFALALIIVIMVSMVLRKSAADKKDRQRHEEMMAVVKASAGGGSSERKAASPGDLQSLANYCAEQGISEEKALGAIKAGLLNAKRVDGAWFVISE